MVKDGDFVYVDRYGNEVAADDPAAQTKYSAAELKALRKQGLFPKRDGEAADAVDDSQGTPVLNSGIGKVDDVPLTPAVDDDADEDDEKSHTRRSAARK